MWGYGPGSGYGMMGGYGYGWGYGLLHVAVTVAVIAAIVFFVIWALRAITGVGPHHPMMGPPGGPRRSSGLDILEERYAKGEIQRDEYLQKKKDITG
jgi:putative membrane protein